jgi:hypothetical protein
VICNSLSQENVLNETSTENGILFTVNFFCKSLGFQVSLNRRECTCQNINSLTCCSSTAAVSCARSLQLKYLGCDIPYILDSNLHQFYSFRGLKNQMQIRIECGLDSRSRAGFWKNDRAGVLTFFHLRRWRKLGAD